MVSSSTNQDFLAVVNPAAGGGRCGRKASEALDELRASGLEIEVRETTAPLDASEIVRREWRRGYRRFLAVGGDGTTWEVLNGLMPLQLDEGTEASLGFLPLGTGNSFLRDFSKDPARHAIDALLEGRSRRVDVLCLEHREGRLFFINLLGWGFVTEVARRAVGLKSWGASGYVLAVVQCLARHRPAIVPYRIDDEDPNDGAATLVCVCNSRFTGGSMMMAPDALVDDGLADVIRAEPLGASSLLATLPRIFSGKHLDRPAVSAHRAQSIEFEIDDQLPMMIDGELVELEPRKIEVFPAALEVWA